jgi:hypothetical protein
MTDYIALTGDIAISYRGTLDALMEWFGHARHEGQVATVWRGTNLVLAIDAAGDVVFFCPPAPPLRRRYHRTDPPRVEAGEASEERLAYLAERARRRLPLFPRPGEADPAPVSPPAAPITSLEHRVLGVVGDGSLCARQIAEALGMPLTARFRRLLALMRRKGLLADPAHGAGYRKETP